MSSDTLSPLALIAGPTASGKSALAMELAERTGGAIVNADSAQLYDALPILSAAPDAEQLRCAEHRLYGFADGSTPCSAAHWSSLARREIDSLHREGRLPILVGGTGLYLRTLLQGIAPVPPINAEVRRLIRSRSVTDNCRELHRNDPGAAQRLDSADSTRIARALEVILSTGRPLSDWQRERVGGIEHMVSLSPLILLPPRDWLYRRCDYRFERMMESGAVTEVEALLARNLDPDLPVMRAIGVREIAGWLRGDYSRDEAMKRGQRMTRRYAKRQYTWFAHQPPPEWPRFTEPLNDTNIADALALMGFQS